MILTNKTETFAVNSKEIEAEHGQICDEFGFYQMIRTEYLTGTEYISWIAHSELKDGSYRQINWMSLSNKKKWELNGQECDIPIFEQLYIEYRRNKRINKILTK